MSLILAWVLFPLVLAAVGGGWGIIVARAAGSKISGALLVPLGMAAVIVVTSVLTQWSLTAHAALPVVGIGAAAGLVLAWPWRPGRWPLLAAVGIVAAYGAPVLLSGQATFTGIDSAWIIQPYMAVCGAAVSSLTPPQRL